MYQDVITPGPNWKPDSSPERAVDHIIEKIHGVEIKPGPLGRMEHDELIELRKQLLASTLPHSDASTDYLSGK
jgi:hypothetical protein